jgi:hypothetical protein
MKSLAKIEPLFFGRVGRVLVGGPGDDTLLAACLILLGVSFLIGGVMGNPGCEITALPNLFLPADKNVHCV